MNCLPSVYVKLISLNALWHRAPLNSAAARTRLYSKNVHCSLFMDSSTTMTIFCVGLLEKCTCKPSMSQKIRNWYQLQETVM